MSNVVWWEKTVEYNFVLTAFQEYQLNLLVPLDGNVESISDTIAGSKNHFFIIEFKKSLTKFSSEYKKYVNGKSGFRDARETMKKLPGCEHHYVIGGYCKKGTRRILLKIKLYFDAFNKHQPKAEKIFQGGMTLDELKIYTETLTAFKNLGDGDSGGAAPNHTSVLAVSDDGKAAMIPLDYFTKPKLINSPTRALKM